MLKKSVSFIVAFLFLFSFLPAANAGSDVKGPDLISVSLNKTEFNAGETLVITIKASDDITGIDVSNCMAVVSGQSGGAGLNLKQAAEENTYTFELFLGKDYYRTGTYKLDYIQLKDKSNNSAIYSVREGTLPLYEFHITNNLRTDWTGPALESVSTQNISARTGAASPYAEPGDRIGFYVRANDPAGVSKAFVSFHHTRNFYWQKGVELSAVPGSPGLFYGEFIVPNYQPDGEYRIYDVWLFDGLGNTSDYRSDIHDMQNAYALPESMQLPIIIKNPGVGIEKYNPLVTELTISPQRVKQGEPVTFTLKLDARGNELKEEANLWIGYHAWEQFSRCGVGLKKQSEGVYSKTLTFPGSWPAGKYDISAGDVMIQDNVYANLDWPQEYYKDNKFVRPAFYVDSVYSGTADVTLPLNAPAFYPMAGVSAANGTEGDMTGRIVVQGSVDTQKTGVYLIKYMIEKEPTPYFNTTKEYYYDFRWVGVTEIMPDPSDPDAPLSLTNDSITIGAESSEVLVERDGKGVTFANMYTLPGEYMVREKSGAAEGGAKAMLD